MKLTAVKWSKKLLPLIGVLITCIFIIINVSGPNTAKMSVPSRLPLHFNSYSEQSFFNHSKTHQSVLTPKQNIFFLKVHKAASSTLQNIFLRYALTNKLNVVLPRSASATHLNEHSSKFGAKDVINLPLGAHFNILTHHVIFNKEESRRLLPSDTIYIGIVREPYNRFVSSLYYYGLVWKFKGLYECVQLNDDPVHAFLTNPYKYDPLRAIRWSQVNNRMSRDFGLSVEGIKNAYDEPEIIENFINKVEYEFDLVLVMEHFDASIILLKRLLNWTFEDILYMKINELGVPIKNKTKSNSETKALFRKFAPSEVALYDHFLSIFLHKVEALGLDFAKEVESFKQTRQIVENFCKNVLVQGLKSQTVLEMEGTKWSPSFLITPQDCSLMKMEEVLLSSLVRVSQKSRWSHVLPDTDDG